MFRRVLGRLRPPSLATAIALLALAVALGGTAVAATSSLVSIADHTTTTNVAKVSAAGALSTSGIVTGTVGPAAPKTPFNVSALSFEDGAFEAQFIATPATLAFTSITVANDTSQAATTSINEFGSPNTSTCSQTATSRFLMEYTVPAEQTLTVPLPTPLVLKPLPGMPDWCLGTFVSGNTGTGFWSNYNGYVVSGTFASAAARPATGAERPGSLTRADPH